VVQIYIVTWILSLLPITLRYAKVCSMCLFKCSHSLQFYKGSSQTFWPNKQINETIYSLIPPFSPFLPLSLTAKNSTNSVTSCVAYIQMCNGKMELFFHYRKRKYIFRVYWSNTLSCHRNNIARRSKNFGEQTVRDDHTHYLSCRPNVERTLLDWLPSKLWCDSPNENRPWRRLDQLRGP